MSTNPLNEIVRINPELDSLSNECIIDLQHHPKKKDEAEAEIKQCETYLKIGDKAINGLISQEKIKRIAFLKLYEDAVKLTGAGRYLTGLKIAFGINAHDNLSLIYTPVRLYNGTSNSGSSTYDKVEGSSFRYDQDAFVPLGKSEEKVLIKAYKDKILIKHSDVASETHTRHVDGDITSMVFPFQEIFAVMYDNGGATASDIFDKNNNNPILIFNYIKKEGTSPANLIQHSLLLSPNLQPGGGSLEVVNFKNTYANLSSLCPPICDIFEFKAECN